MIDQRRFQEKSIGDITNHPALIVGQNPGRQRMNEMTGVVWEGNRSADLLLRTLAGQTGIYLTNICNYREMTPEHVKEGLYDLQKLIDALQPRVVICLGAYSHLGVRTLSIKCPIIKLAHPSHIARFNKDREEYKKRFTNALLHV